MVLWFLGKSSAGKTYIGEKLYKSMKKNHLNLVFLDGDILRNTISKDLSHSIKDRHTSEQRRSSLSKLLSDQNINVIMSGLSNAPDIREWNKKNIKNYVEVYLKTERTTLYNRDPKGIYERYKAGQTTNVVGEDIKFIEPTDPWLTIKNDGEKNADEIVRLIYKKLSVEKILL